ncbi:uncharacterized protein LOC143597511 [Bidens hawaiensis]|uniref:uncharacterized protein LOC143597511 n=1 Tax=Bidens hawaiensis TaxID=980011 RepID=UPI00404A859F
MALQEPYWVDSMHEELNQFDKLNVWRLVELPIEKKALDTRWVFRNNTALCSEFEEVMKKRFETSSLREMTTFLGLQVRHSLIGILLQQKKYVEDMLEKFEFQDSKSVPTPMGKDNFFHMILKGNP